MQGPKGDPGQGLDFTWSDPIPGSEPRLIVQLGLGDDGQGYTFWIEDGQ
jgi:hypothetical protein